MRNVRILDCTLRDGGRIINCEFQDGMIKDISDRLALSKIDIVEVGFLRDHRKVDYQGNSTFFTDVDQISKFIDHGKNSPLYVAFVDYGMFDIDSLKPYDGTSIDGIRLGFTKKNYTEHYDDVLRWMRIIKESGYKLFVQGVNSLNYSDRELLELVDVLNEAQPYSFGMVDTYGAMYMDDVDRIYHLINNNLNNAICINFHSHDNYTLSFALAQEVIKLSKNNNRQIMIDATLNGMGKGAGNLNTELLADFLNRKHMYDYDLDEILDLIDDDIYPYSINHKWGFSIPSMMAGVYKSHPNNIMYLTEKFRLKSKDVGKLLSMIDEEKRQRYDYDNINRLYDEYVAEKIDDRKVVATLREKFENQIVLVMAPGNTLNTHKTQIDAYIAAHNPYIIGVNFVPSYYPDAYCFMGNQRRFTNTKAEQIPERTIITSNLTGYEGHELRVNYDSLIDRRYEYFNNSVIMLLNLIRKCNPAKITIAGFDGFDAKLPNNYLDYEFQNDRHIAEFEHCNSEISKMYAACKEKMEGKCEMILLTPSFYDQ